MKAFAIIGASVLGKSPFVPRLVEALRLDDRTVSVIKHAPDGFDIDQPGKASHTRREAGAREVMLVGDRRLVLMREYGRAPEPRLDVLLARLDPVDIVIVEGFRKAALPTLEVHRPSRGCAPRWPSNPRVVAIVSDEEVVAPLPCFELDDLGSIAHFVAARAQAVRRAGAVAACL